MRIFLWNKNSARKDTTLNEGLELFRSCTETELLINVTAGIYVDTVKLYSFGIQEEKGLQIFKHEDFEQSLPICVRQWNLLCYIVCSTPISWVSYFTKKLACIMYFLLSIIINSGSFFTKPSCCMAAVYLHEKRYGYSQREQWRLGLL